MTAMRAMLLLAVVGSGAWAQPATVEGSASAEPRRFEVTLIPAAVQVNGRFTQHAGTFGTFTWYVRERFGLQLLGGANWLNEESAFNSELVEKFRVEAQWATSLLWTWGLFAGTEVEPFAGELMLLGGPRLRLGLVLSVAAGAGGTRHQLKPPTETPATYVDTGVHFMGTVSVGARLQIGERVTVRLGVRDVIYSAQVSSVNGCSQFEDPFRLANGFSSGGCLNNLRDPGDAARAASLLQRSSSDVINNLSVSLGVGLLW